MSYDRKEKEALHNFSTAFLINFIFGILSTLLVASTITSWIFYGIMSNPTVSFSLYLILSALVSIIGTIIYIYYLYRGFDLMEEIVSGISHGKIGAILMIFSVAIYPFIYPFFTFHTYLGPPEMSWIALVLSVIVILGVLGLIGIILVVISLYRIGENYDSTIIKIGAVLLIFLGFIGSILLYIGFRDLETKSWIKKAIILPPPPPA